MVALLGALGVVEFRRQSRKDVDALHAEAMAAWPALVESKFVREPKDVARTFVRCFRKGDPAAKYESLFIRAKKMAYPNQREYGVNYRWFCPLDFHGEGPGAYLCVVVKGEPPVISDVYVAPLVR